MSESLQQLDSRARAAALRVFDHALVLEAGAGTGKTTALVGRVLAWCLGPGWERAAAQSEAGDLARGGERIAARVLRGVVAITFTEKAAADMNRRVGDGLREVARGDWPVWLGEPPDSLQRASERAVALRGALDHLTMQTIHAWCRKLLADHALDAGLHPNLDVDADRRSQRAIVREVLDDALETAYGDSGNSAFLELARRGVGPRDLEVELLELVDAGVTPQALATDPARADRVEAFVVRIENSLEAVRQPIAGRRGLGDVGDATADRLDATAAAIRAQRPGDAAQLEAWLPALDWPDREVNRIAEWAKGKFNKGEAALLEDSAAELALAAKRFRSVLQHARGLDLPRLAFGRSVLSPLLARVDTAMRQRGVATFAALLSETRALLAERADVAARVRAQIDQLMVDEFQDTDERQCAIIRTLALRGPESERPGLFLVGDPKQSIYGWRNADLGAYDAFVDEVLRAGGVRERLSVNYRSVPHVLDEVERCISGVMVARHGEQPPFQPLIACSDRANEVGFSQGGFVPVEHWVSTAWDEESQSPLPTRSTQASELEARALAAELRELHDRHGVGWESVGVLFRSRTDWEIYLAALREAGVPYAVEGDRSYYRRREIIEAACLVRCVLDPGDTLALLTWLRSSCVGVPDAALIPLWAHDVPARIAQLDGCDPAAPAQVAALADTIREAAREVPQDVPGLERVRGWEENLIDAVAAISELRASFALDPSDVFVERLRTRTLFETVEAARYLGAWRCANLDRFFRDLRERLDDAGNVPTLLRELRRAVVDEEESEEGRPVDIRSEAVCVMTIHGAKGLDFDHVYLMQLHKGSGNTPRDARGASEVDGEFEYSLLGAATLSWDRVLDERHRVAEAERVRLVYVAMTRARDRLVLSGVWPEFQSHPRGGQPIGLLSARPPEDLRGRLVETAHARRSGFSDAFGARWSLPARAEIAPQQAVLFEDESPSAPDPARVLEDARRLSALRDSAAARMARPVGAAASGAGVVAAERVRANSGSGTGREPFARQVGTAIHRILEELDLTNTVPQALAWARDELRAELTISVAPEALAAALADAAALLERIANGGLFARLLDLAPNVEARELPVLCAPTDSAGDTGPVGYWSGAIDLVYRDPETGRAVIADYKTDRVDDVTDERAAAYRDQGAVYQRALREALALDYTPRFELWFLDADRIV
jgi:ATP-dependent helicase/nuclease subunit A